MDLQNKLRDFSAAGLRKHPTRDLLLVGLGCAEWTWPIVEDAAVKGWLGTNDGVAHLRKVNWDLGMVVGAVVFNHTRDDFAWSTVCKIIESSGQHKMNEGIISHFAHLYPLGISKFYTEPGARNVKRVTQDMAKAALWVEALTFLDNEGFAERLKH